MLVKIKQKIRCGTVAEEDDSSAYPDSLYAAELYVENQETIARYCDCY